MNANEVRAEWAEDAGRLTLRFGRTVVELTPERFCDATYTVKGDVMVLRTTAMTRYAFEGWKKGIAEEPFASVKAYVDHCEARLRGSAS